METNPIPSVLRKQMKWQDLFFYQKADALYQMTVVYCKRFLPAHGDRTVDQMVQAARSGKQNIVEGLADGVTSTQMQLQLLNVARASIQELQQDFYDQLNANQLPLWDSKHPRYNSMLRFCREHNLPSDYAPFFDKWSREYMANIGYTMCRMTDKMMMSVIQFLDKQFVTEGGIKERMYAARTGYRQGQDERLRALEAENATLKQTIIELQQKLSALEQKSKGKS